MKRKILTTALALMALTITFNSCREDEDDDEFKFPSEQVGLTGDIVLYSLDDLSVADFYTSNEYGYEIKIYVGTDPSVDSTFSQRLKSILPYKKYYWYAQVETNKNNTYSVSEKSEMHTLYYLPAPEIAVHNVEGDWAAVVTWKHNDLFKDATITLTPDKDCEYDKTPITVSATQDSCYISAGSEFSKKYTVYHQWWDDSKAQYYEPVVYSFTATFSGEADGTPFTVTAAPVNYIFLDRATYAADKQFNVYRMGRIGNRTWLLEDLRGTPLYEHYDVVSSPLGFQAVYYSGWEAMDENLSKSFIPEGCHLASDADWQDLEYTYGVQNTNYNDYYTDEQSSDVFNRFGWGLPNGIIDLESEISDSIKYVGQSVDIVQMLISKDEWISVDSTHSNLNGLGGFNARPYGICSYLGNNIKIGQVAVFLTSTVDVDSGKGVIRVIWSGNKGIGREYVGSEIFYSIKYLLRCVKDE